MESQHGPRARSTRCASRAAAWPGGCGVGAATVWLDRVLVDGDAGKAGLCWAASKRQASAPSRATVRPATSRPGSRRAQAPARVTLAGGGGELGLLGLRKAGVERLDDQAPIEAEEVCIDAKEALRVGPRREQLEPLLLERGEVALPNPRLPLDLAQLEPPALTRRAKGIANLDRTALRASRDLLTHSASAERPDA